MGRAGMEPGPSREGAGRDQGGAEAGPGASGGVVWAGPGPSQGVLNQRGWAGARAARGGAGGSARMRRGEEGVPRFLCRTHPSPRSWGSRSPGFGTRRFRPLRWATVLRRLCVGGQWVGVEKVNEDSGGLGQSLTPWARARPAPWTRRASWRRSPPQGKRCWAGAGSSRRGLGQLGRDCGAHRGLGGGGVARVRCVHGRPCRCSGNRVRPAASLPGSLQVLALRAEGHRGTPGL
jgi:hypothetical protein